MAVFRPADDRLREAIDLLKSLDVDPISDPMLAVHPTGGVPRADADIVVLTSKTGVELAADAGWEPTRARVCAIGEATANACRDHGYTVDIVPAEFSSTGLVATLQDDIRGDRVEIARSDHGSEVLVDGLVEAGAYVHETVLYRLDRPEGAGESVEMAVAGQLAGACFTSSLTVKHFLDLAEEGGVREDAVDGLADAVVGAIGEPTRETATAAGIEVEVVPETASFEALARAVVADLGE